jgi:molybdopterin molybdotransferase
MAAVSLSEARAAVVAALGDAVSPATQRVPLAQALGRVLAEDVLADRDQPPFDRSTRDGFAVRASDVAQATQAAPVSLPVVGEVPAGVEFAGEVGPGACVGIMTGAPLPAGTDAVVMVEHTRGNGAHRAPGGGGRELGRAWQ